MKSVLFGLALCAGLFATGALAAQEVTERIEGGALSFVGGQNFTNGILRITGPNDFEAEVTAIRGLPVFRAVNSGRLVDGFYQYFVSAATDEKVEIKNPIDNGRGTAARNYLLKPFSAQGGFQVKNGTIVAVDGSSGGADVDTGEEQAGDAAASGN